MATEFLKHEAELGNSMQEDTAIICIRSGKLGSFVKPTSSSGFWVPAYHTDATAARVEDPTGGGNSWLGAFAALMVQAASGRSRHDLLADNQLALKAGQCASVSACEFVLCEQPSSQSMTRINLHAAYAIEQRGLPSIGHFFGNVDNATVRLCELQNRPS